MRSIKRQNHRRIWLVIFVIILILFCAAIVVLVWSIETSAPSSDNQTKSSTKQTQPPQPKTITSNVLFLGNTFWGRYIDDWSMANPLKYKYPFSRLNEFNRDKYNAWISGLECPVVAGVHMTSAEMEQALQFNCSPNYLPEAAQWFTVFTLANNHTDNQGAAGFKETQQQLEKNGIQYFGNYDPTVIDDVCEVISLPASVINNDNSTKKGKLPVVMCGFHGVFRIPPDESVAIMKKYSQYMPVIAMPHMGTEYQSSPDELKTSFYRRIIDGGADMVLGDHPHWIQTTESYKGHLIVYSLGNFMFDQQDTPEVVRSAGINVFMKTADTDSTLLEKWLALGDKCLDYKDNCLNIAKQQKLTKLSINYKFGVVGTSDSDKITKPANSVQQSSILDRLNWQSTVDQLRPPYSSL